MVINMGFSNRDLYAGIEFESIDGRLRLKTQLVDASAIVGRNIARIVAADVSKLDVCTLQGSSELWAYAAVFETVHVAYREVRYNDGTDEVVLFRKS